MLTEPFLLPRAEVGVISLPENESSPGLPRRRPWSAVSAVGLALAVAGAVLPSSWLLEALGVAAASDARRLWLGAALFRLGLAGLGLYLVVAARLPIWNGRSRPPAVLPPRPRWASAALIGIVLVALGLRLHRLGAGLWLDEINAQFRYMGLSFGEILTTYDQESQHVLFTLLARGAVLLLGDGPAAFRVPAALFGAASVAALYALARRVATEREALLSAALLAVSYHHLWFSQNARGYTALLFWTLLSSWLFLRALDEERSGLWVGYAASVALGMFSHVTMLFAVLGHVAVYASRLARGGAAGDPAAWKGAVLGFGLAGLFTFQLYALMLPQFFSIIGWTGNIPEWTDPMWALRELAHGLRSGLAGSAAAAAGAVAVGAGLVSFARQAPAIVAFVLAPALAGTTVLVAMDHPLFPRFFFFLLGFGALISVRGATAIGAGLARLLRRPAAGARAGTAIAGLMILVSATTVPAAWRPKQDYLGARSFVEARREPGDAIVTIGLATFPYESVYRTGWEAASSAEALEAIRARSPRTWVLYTMPVHLERLHPELIAAVRRDFTLVKKFAGTMNGGTIYVCLAGGAPSAGAAPARPAGSD